jgi:hypothetical protein
VRAWRGADDTVLSPHDFLAYLKLKVFETGELSLDFAFRTHDEQFPQAAHFILPPYLIIPGGMG